METPSSVLLIDGDEDSLRIFATILDHHGFRVLTARDDDAGYRHAWEDRPDLIVCDPFTQRVRGERLAGLLRDDPRTAGIPVVVLSAVPHHALGIGLRAAVLLAKPCKPEVFVHEVRQHLSLLAAAMPR